jgi:hypothetical protein
MKSFHVVLLAVALASPALMLAGGQPNRVRMVTKVELQHQAAARAINQGKGAGITRKQAAAPAVKQAASHASDTAFTK